MKNYEGLSFAQKLQKLKALVKIMNRPMLADYLGGDDHVFDDWNDCVEDLELSEDEEELDAMLSGAHDQLEGVLDKTIEQRAQEIEREYGVTIPLHLDINKMHGLRHAVLDLIVLAHQATLKKAK